MSFQDDASCFTTNGCVLNIRNKNVAQSNSMRQVVLTQKDSNQQKTNKKILFGDASRSPRPLAVTPPVRHPLSSGIDTSCNVAHLNIETGPI